MKIAVCDCYTKQFLNKAAMTKALLCIVFCTVLALFFTFCTANLYDNRISIENKLEHKIIEPEINIQSVLNDFGKKIKKRSPQLKIQPIVNATSKTVLIWYDEQNVATIDKWINYINHFLDEYKTDMLPRNTASFCDFNHPPRLGQMCPVDIDSFGPCSPPYYGYYDKSPCIFLQLEQVYGWKPNYYNDLNNLPSSMPKDLIADIKLADARNEGNQVWVSCEGELSADKEHVETFKYYPRRGFPSYYFSSKYKMDVYLSPIIAVEIVNPTPGVIIGIECRLWANNAEYKAGTSQERIGSVHFGIMKDEWNGEWGSREEEHTQD